jgi:serine/threonine-protein kinase
MIRLHLFGSIELRNPESIEVRSVLAYSKHTALLAYLACSHRVTHRREQLAALLWPDLDEARARNALSKANHHLRRELGEGVIVARGSDEVGIARGHIWCDVAAFDDALVAGRHAEAIALYRRGELLDGFHLSGTPEFDRYIEGERHRRKQQALDAIAALADAAEHEDDLTSSIQWMRLASKMAPEDEVTVRRLLLLMDRAGDRAGAIARYEEWVAYLARELDVMPSPESQALVASMRARRAVRSSGSRPSLDSIDSGDLEPPGERTRPDVTGAPDLGESIPTTESDARPASTIGTRPRLPRARRATGRVLGIAAVILGGVAIAVSSATWGSRRWTQLAAEKSTRTLHRVLVLPFENRTGDQSLDRLGVMSAEWISQALQQTGFAEVLAPSGAIVVSRRRPDATGPDSVASRESTMGRASGAQTVVWGSIYRQGDTLVFRSQVTDVATDHLLVALDPVMTSASNVLAGAERVRETVGGALASILDRRFQAFSAPTSRPPTWTAYREFMAGIEVLDRGRTDDALRYFAKATKADSTFTQPLIYSICSSDGDTRASQLRVLASLADRLSRFDQLALDFFNAPDLATQYSAARAASDMSPASQWTMIAARLAAAFGRPAESRRLSLRVDPEQDWTIHLHHDWNARLTATHLMGDYTSELSDASTLRRLEPDGNSGRFFELRALIGLHRFADVDSLVADWPLTPEPSADLPGDLLRKIGLELQAHGDSAHSRPMFEMALAWFRSPAARRAIVISGRDSASMDIELQNGVAEVQGLLGDWRGAQATADSLLARVPNDPIAAAVHGLAAAHLGNRVEAERTIAALGPKDCRHKARIYAVLGDTLHLMQTLRGMMAIECSDYGTFMNIHRERDFNAFRSYPPFVEFVRPKG